MIRGDRYFARRYFARRYWVKSPGYIPTFFYRAVVPGESRVAQVRG